MGLQYALGLDCRIQALNPGFGNPGGAYKADFAVVWTIPFSGPSANISMAKKKSLIDRYRDYLTQQGKSPNTVNAYGRDVGAFAL